MTAAGIGRCQCGARVRLVIDDGKFTTPGHVCGRGVGKVGAEVSAIRSAGSCRASTEVAKVEKSSLARPAKPEGTNVQYGHTFAPTAALSGRTLRLWLPRSVRSAEGPNGRAWQAKARAAREWRELVAAALEVLGDRQPRWARARVHYELYTRGRAIDPDNRVALGKPILDGLVAAGVLPDDRDEQVEDVSASWAPSPLPWGFVVVRARSARASTGGAP